MRAPRGRRGFTIVELIVAIVVSTIVLGAAYGLLLNNQRFYRSQTQIVDVQSNVRAVAQILPAELRELSPTGGDIMAMSDTSVTIRAMRALGIVCDVSDSANARLVLRNSQWYGYRAIDPERDGIFIFRDADTLAASDDGWVLAGVAQTSNEACEDDTPGTRVDLENVVGGAGVLSGVTLGSPVRTFETVRYHLYQDAGAWWLGVSTLAEGTWSGSSPVAGPLLEGSGLAFSFLDAAGAAATDSSRVRTIRVTVRGESSQPINMQGRPQGLYRDSLTVRAALRGN